jgi:hypothetical protein
VDQVVSNTCNECLAARGVVYMPEHPYIVTRSCPGRQRERQCILTALGEEEGAACYPIADWLDAEWHKWRASGYRRKPEVPEEIRRLEKWLQRRTLEADKRVFGEHIRGAIMYGYRRAKEMFPGATDYIEACDCDLEKA